MRCILTVNFSPWSPYSGGGQRSTHNLARALARRGHRVSVVYTKPPWEQVQLPAALPYEVVWAALPALRSRSGALLRQTTPLFVAQRVAALSAGTREPVIVHGNGEEAALIADLRRRFGRPLGFVMTPRYPALPSRLIASLLPKFRWLGKALRDADRICPTSRSAADMVAHAFALDRAGMEIIPNGVSQEFIRAFGEAADLRPLGAELTQFISAGPFGVYFGRIAPEKGVRTLVEALGLLQPRLRFVFAGRGPDTERLERRIRALGLSDHVRFVHWLEPPALAQLVRRAELAVLPSLEESFGNTMAEAMALGVPVVATRAGSIPEVVEPDRTGVLVEPGDPAALSGAIAALRRDPERRRQLGEAGRARVISQFTWEASAARFEQIYRALVDAPAKTG